MIDFSTVKSIVIPEGVVKQITDSTGRVLWRVRKPVTVTITLTGSDICYVDYKGARYTAPATFEADVGDEIFIETTAAPTGGVIYLNGERVASSSGTARYTYAVACDLNIDVQKVGSGTSIGVRVYLTEIPEGHALVQITGDGNYGYNAKVTIDGISYNGAKTLTVPVGTEILCEAKDDDRDRRSCIYVNGTQVVKHTNATYTYSVPENVKVVNIRLEVPDYYGMIYITEQ